MTSPNLVIFQGRQAYELYVGGLKLEAVAREMGLTVSAAARRVRGECERRHGYRSLVRLREEERAEHFGRRG